MPKQKRWALKRELEYAIGNIDAAGVKLCKVASEFKGVHNEYHDLLLAIFLSCATIEEAIKRVRDSI